MIVPYGLFLFFVCTVYLCVTVAADVYVFKHKNVYLSDRGLIIIGFFLYTTPQNNTDVVWKSQKFVCLKF